MARGFEARCEAGHVGPDGWVDLTDTYKEAVGRRYVQSYGLPAHSYAAGWAQR